MASCVTPSSSRPPLFGVRPPHCLTKNARRSQSVRRQLGAVCLRLAAVKRPLLRALEGARLLHPAYRTYEAVRALSAARGVLAPDGLPLPPARLRVTVAGTADPEWFLESGLRTHEIVVDTLARHGLDVEVGTSRILDYGCGCGRVTRYWARFVGAEVQGTDYNPSLVRWCADNLPFGFSANELEPPLPLPDDGFDAVYGISVLTHLPERLGLDWLAELRRVVRPGGLLLLTTHGDHYRERLTTAERTDYEAGRLVVRWGTAAGTNLCTTFHSPAYIARTLAQDLELLEHESEGAAAGTPWQDVVVLRKPT